jgi:serine/threonine protein kinase
MTHQRYVHLSLLGQGGYGKVFLALDTISGTYVALKETRDDTLEHERLILTRIHEQGFIQGLPRLLDTLIPDLPEQDRDDHVHLVLEYVEGQTMYEIADQSLPFSTIINAITDFCNIMANLHTIGIVHHDLSDKNILLSKSGDIHILDFGSAYLAPYGLPRTFHADVIDMICIIEDWINRLGEDANASITSPFLFWLDEEQEKLHGSESLGEDARSFLIKWEQIRDQTLASSTEPSQSRAFLPHQEEKEDTHD